MTQIEFIKLYIYSNHIKTLCALSWRKKKKLTRNFKNIKISKTFAYFDYIDKKKNIDTEKEYSKK